ncbi:hypothetical protein Zm00014a_033382 [Zea mays]|nr:hypothetical protein Zm00014a_033382 [Zea mays]
MSNKSCI